MSKGRTAALIAACTLVVAFVVSFALGLRRDGKPIELPGATLTVPDLDSGRRVEVLNASGQSVPRFLRMAGLSLISLAEADAEQLP